MYNIIGLHSYAYEVDEAGASSALYWTACLWLNQLFAEHDNFWFTKLRTRVQPDSQVTSCTCDIFLGMVLYLLAHALLLRLNRGLQALCSTMNLQPIGNMQQ